MNKIGRHLITIWRQIILMACVALLTTACGGSDKEFAAPFEPGMGEIAAEWELNEDVVAPLVVTGELVSFLLDSDGFVIAREQLPDDGEGITYRDYMGFLRLDGDVLSGEVSWLDIPPPPTSAPVETGKAQFTAVLTDLENMAGLIDFGGGDSTSFDLQRSVELVPVAVDERLAGLWDGPYNLFSPNPYALGLEFDNTGEGFGVLDETCVLNVSLSGLKSSPSESSSTGTTVVHKLSASVSSCDLAAEYFGTAFIMTWGNGALFLNMFWANTETEQVYVAIRPPM